MTHKNKVRGNNLEREVVNAAKEVGHSSKRAYASDGRSLGKSEVVDVMVENYCVQAKRRKRIAQWLKPPKSCDIALVREDRGETYVIIEYDDFLEIVAYMKEMRNNGGTTKKFSMFDDK